MSLSRLLAMSRKEALQLRRDRRSLALAFLLPLALILFFGYAISFDVKDIDLAVVDHSRSPASRALVEAFVSSGHFRVCARPDADADVEPLFHRSAAQVALVIPADFARHLAIPGRARVQLLLDGSDASTATIAQGYADAIVGGFSERRGAAAGILEAETRVWYNQTLESRNAIVPGLVAVIMSIIAALLTALAIAREWERGTLEQLAATPVHRLEVVLGKLLPYVAIGLVDVAVAVAAGILVFHVPFRGDVLLLAVLTLLFLVGALSLGLFISAATRSQVLATQVAIISTYLPALLLSGFIFSIATMPPVLRALTFAIPARYYVEVARGIFLKGVGAGVLWADAVAMVVFATVSLALAARAFRKEL